MHLRRKVSIVLGSFLLAVAGCQEPQQAAPSVGFQGRTIAVEDLAARLGLRIEEKDQTFVVLRNAANTVLIFTHADGRLFVNGKPIGLVGAVERTGDTVCVPETLVATIRSHLRASGSEQSPAVVPPTHKVGGATVVIDPGHGGKDPGTTVGGTHEKHIVLRVARQVAALLEQRGVNVVMTRQDDRFIELEDRAQIANRRDTDLFVSIHADSAPDRSISGFTLYVASGASREAHNAARAVSAAMSRAGSDTRGIREADYKVLVQTSCPAILIELGYLSNYADARHLQDSAFQTRLAQAIAAGILDYLQ
ncbi:MAG: N-acetylmuramoyl-L-alanine amidase [Sedimentisphaerales bacterium]|nr:N-acetylmuramoyl-L-alanine amidase [Sedimentisphaerales bacterium]